MNMIWYVWLPLLALIIVLVIVEFVLRRRYQRMRTLIDAFRISNAFSKASRGPQTRESAPDCGQRDPRADWVAQRNE